MIRLSVVMLAYGEEPWLVDAAQSVLASTGVEVELILVDNGCTSDGVERVTALPRVRVTRPERNLGFAGGCNHGAALAVGELLVFVNSDAVVTPTTLARIAAVASEPQVGAAMAAIRLADQPDLINSAGNPLHYAGLSWAGGMGEPASAHAEPTTVPSISGCCFAIRRELWLALAGFAAEYFAYHEDAELSLRLRQRGLRLEYVPDAVAYHHYEFSRNRLKLYLVERNRIATLLTTYQSRTLLVLAPMLGLVELAILAKAVAGGWGRAKLDGWRWLWDNRAWLRARRALLQAERTVPDAVIAQRMTARLDAASPATSAGVGVFNAVSRAYWTVARRLLPQALTRADRRADREDLTEPDRRA